MPLVLSGDGSVGPLSATEVGYLDGVTSGVQTQINSKLTTPGAWSSWSPTVTSSGGTITTSVVNAATYTQIGKTVFVAFDVTISNAGTGSGALQVSLPVTPLRVNHGIAREINSTGSSGAAEFRNSTGLAYVVRYDNATLIATGYRVIVNGCYEVA